MDSNIGNDGIAPCDSQQVHEPSTSTREPEDVDKHAPKQTNTLREHYFHKRYLLRQDLRKVGRELKHCSPDEIYPLHKQTNNLYEYIGEPRELVLDADNLKAISAKLLEKGERIIEVSISNVKMVCLHIYRNRYMNTYMTISLSATTLSRRTTCYGYLK